MVLVVYVQIWNAGVSYRLHIQLETSTQIPKNSTLEAEHELV
jgi:hypothetical protein